MFACACALFAFVSNAEAQKTGDIVTITCKSGNSTYYLAVNDDGNAIVNGVTEESKNCYWEITVDDNIYTFKSVISGLYLTINNSSLSLEEEPQNITRENNILYISQENWFWTTTYYIRYNKGWTISTNNSTNLTIKTVDYNPLHNLTLVSPAQGDVTANQIKTIRLLADAPIEVINENTTENFYLSNGASIETVDVDENNNQQLVITTNASYKEGENYALSISEGAVKVRTVWTLPNLQLHGQSLHTHSHPLLLKLAMQVLSP